MRENEGTVKVNRLLVVLGSLGELSQNEVELSAVVVNVRVILIVSDSKFKVIGSRIFVSYLTVE